MSKLRLLSSICVLLGLNAAIAPSEQRRLEVGLTNVPSVVLRWKPKPLAGNPQVFPPHQLQMSSDLVQWSPVGALVAGDAADPGPQERAFPYSSDHAFFRLSGTNELPRLEIALTNQPELVLRWTVPALSGTSPAGFQAQQLQISSNLVDWVNFGAAVPVTASINPQELMIPLTNSAAFFRLATVGFSDAPAPTVLPPPKATGNNGIVLRGTAGAGLTVRVEGGAGTVSGVAAEDGTFGLTVSLGSNRVNHLVVTTVDANGFISLGTTVDVLQDSQPPSLFVDFPTGQSPLTTSNTVVAGRVSDRLSGLSGLTVTISSLPASPAPVPALVHIGNGVSGTFARSGLPLADGTNVVTVSATDRFGNTATKSITLLVQQHKPNQPWLVIAGGDEQSSAVQRPLAQPIVVKAARGATPLIGRVLNFQVTGSDGRLLPRDAHAVVGGINSLQSNHSYTSNGVLNLQVRTDGNGQARVLWALGAESGHANNRVCVSSEGISNTVCFCASALAGSPARLHLGSGNNQRIRAGTVAPDPLRVKVTDSRNGVAGVPVTFRIAKGSGKLHPVPPDSSGFAPARIRRAVAPVDEGTTSITVMSDETGDAQCLVEGGSEEENQVEAVSGDGSDPDQRTSFVVSGVQSDPEQGSSFVGLVLNEAHEPLGHAHCVLKAGSVTLETFSETLGTFVFDNIPAGRAELTVFGDTVTSIGPVRIQPNAYGTAFYRTDIIPNVSNELPEGAVILPQRAGTFYTGDPELVLSHAGVDGLKVKIKGGSMHHPDGGKVTPSRPALVSLNPVKVTDLPITPPDGASSTIAWYLEPLGATFDERLEVEAPNTSGLPAGSAVSFVQYDADSGRWESVASGHVSSDGSTIRTDPDEGFEEAWLATVTPPNDRTASGNRCVMDISGPDFVFVGEQITLSAPPAQAWQTELLDGQVTVEEDVGALRITGTSPGDVVIRAFGPSIDGANCGAERLIRVLSHLRDPVTPPAPFAISGEGWTIGSVEVSANDGVVLHDVFLGSRKLAQEISLPYFSLEWQTTAGPGSRRCQLRPDGNESIARSRLVHFAATPSGDANRIVIEADYQIDRIPDSSSTASLSVYQRYILVKHDPNVDCNSNEATCARLYPLVEYGFTPGSDAQGNEVTLRRIRFPQRFEFQPDGQLRTHPGFAFDFPSIGLQFSPSFNILSTIRFVPDNENPATHEFGGRAVVNGESPLGNFFIDNYHQTTGIEIGTPFPVSILPTGFDAHAGCAECVHIHWRWGAPAGADLGLGGHGFDADWGNPIIPKGSKQTIIVGHALAKDNEKDPDDWGKLILSENDPEAYSGQGDRVAFWYEGSSRANHDEFFVHGIFFLPSSELHENHPVTTTRALARPNTIATVTGTLRSPILRSLSGSNSIPLDNTWTLRLNGREARAAASGSFFIPNVPVRPGQLGIAGEGEWVRLRGYSLANRAVRYVSSDFFQLGSGNRFSPPNLKINVIPPIAPLSLSATLDSSTLNRIGRATQMRVTARYSNGETQDVTPNAAHTNYRSSNPRIARVDLNGMVTAVRPGKAFITAANDGAIAVVEVNIASDAATTVSPIVLDNQPGGGGAVVQVGVGGSQSVSNVVFFDNGTPVGEGEQGIGNTWTLNLPFDPATPQAHQISTRVTTDDGTTVDSETRGFLLADNSKFVPINADGNPGYGEFVSVDPSGGLGPFQFYPEGLGDIHLNTGAHFDFPAGATLSPGGVNGIQFTAARFFRGSKDGSPLVASAGTHSIDLGSITPVTLISAFGLPANTALKLLWGSIGVDWQDGALAQLGWSALKIRPPIGDFILPPGLECSQVVFDPRTSEPSLLICYHGEWAPFSSGPIFRIPRPEPLKIYVSLTGKISAYATVEADFGNGTTVRGSVAWREPNFEVRFQGRNIVIPALASLKRALPANPEQCIPSGTSTAELDAAAKCLSSFRDTYRALAMGGLAEVNTASSDSFAPLVEPTDSVGTALAAWAARLASWTSDRAGQVLDPQMLSDLRKVVENAATTAEAAHDLPTVLKLLRDFLLVARDAPVAVGPSAEGSALLQLLPELQPRLFAAASRIISDVPVVKTGTDFSETTRLLAEISKITSPAAALAATSLFAPAKLAKTSDGGEFDNLLSQIITKADPNIFSDRGIEAGDFDGTDNGLLESHSIDELLDFLDQIQDVFDLLVTSHVINAIDDPLSPYPLDEAVSQTEFWLGLAHREVCEAAMEQHDAPAIVIALRQRLRILDRYAALGLAIPPEGDTFLPPVAEVALALEEPFARQLQNVPRDDRLKILKPVTELLSSLSKRVQDPRLSEYLDGVWLELSDADSAILAALSGTGDCDELESELTFQGYHLRNLQLGNEGLHLLPITGKYESKTGITTVQLNQAGRYLSGYYARYRLEGILTRDTANLVEYAYVRRASGGNAFYGRLTAVPDGQRIKVTITQDTGGPVSEVFIQTTPVPKLPESVIDSFPGRSREIISSVERFPLHSRQLAAILKTLPQVQDAVTNFVRVGSDLNAQLPYVNAFNNIVRNLQRNVISQAQIPQLFLVYQQALSKLRPPGNTRTYWELVLVMFVNHGDQMPGLQQMLGGSPHQTGGAGIFTYDCTLNGLGVQGDIEIFNLGGALINIHIVKTRPDGTTDTFDLQGLVGQGGVGAEFKKGLEGEGGGDNFSLPVDVLKLDEHVVVTSFIDYQKDDLAGPLIGLDGEAGVGLSVPVPSGGGIEITLGSVSASGLALFGSGLLPPLVLTSEPEVEGPDFEITAGEVEFEGGFEAGVNATVGYVWAPGDALAKLTAPKPVGFSASQNITVDSAIFFDTGQDVVRPCGWQFLRRLVGEYAGIFAGSNARVRVLGMTDTVDTDAFNVDLSRRRAENVTSALVQILGPGPFLGVPDTKMLALGLGELAGRNNVNPANIPALNIIPPEGTQSLVASEPWIVDFIARRRQFLGTIDDNTPAAKWRSVVVLLNNTVVMELTDSGGTP